MPQANFAGFVTEIGGNLIPDYACLDRNCALGLMGDCPDLEERQ